MRTLRSFLPATDVHTSDGRLTVTMDVPGFAPEQLDVELDGNLLAVRGERALPTAPEGRWALVERGFGRFERVLQVPDGLDPDAVEASLVDGVLTLQLALPEAPKPHRIEIGAPMHGEPATVDAPADELEETPAEDRELVGATA
jgi:HSP20 family protein